MITAVDGDNGRRPQGSRAPHRRLGPKKIVELAILRNGAAQTIDVTLGAMPADKQLARLETPRGARARRPRSPSWA